MNKFYTYDNISGIIRFQRNDNDTVEQITHFNNLKNIFLFCAKSDRHFCIFRRSAFRIYSKICGRTFLRLFIRGKLRTSKIDYGDKFYKNPCLFTFSSEKQPMITNGSALLRYAMINSLQKVTRDKIKYIRHKNT